MDVRQKGRILSLALDRLILSAFKTFTRKCLKGRILALCAGFACLFLTLDLISVKMLSRNFPGGPVVKNLPSNAGDTGSIPGWRIKSHTPGGN